MTTTKKEGIDYILIKLKPSSVRLLLALLRTYHKQYAASDANKRVSQELYDELSQSYQNILAPKKL